MNTLLRALVAIALGLAGLVAIAPAEAISEHPTPVYFTRVHDRIPRTVDLYNTSPEGVEYKQSLGTVSDHPALVCPKNHKFRLSWKDIPRRAAPMYWERPGECFRPGPGPVYVHVWKAKR